VTQNYVRVALAVKEMQQFYRIRHPNVVEVYEAGMLRSPQGVVVPFVLLHYIEGNTLEEWMTNWRQTAPPAHEIQPLAAKAVHVLADTVRFLHTKFDEPILHHDLKPANIMVAGGESSRPDATSLRIIDYGSFGGSSEELQIGTRAYMAPERHAYPTPPASTQWDLFSLGATLYYLITGEHPGYDSKLKRPVFHFEKIADTDLRKICQTAVHDVSTSRYDSAQQLAEDLAAWLADEPIPHLGRAYTRFEKETMLLRRCWKTGTTTDQLRLFVRSCGVMSALFVAASLLQAVWSFSGRPVGSVIHDVDSIVSSTACTVALGSWIAAR
jgi:serine/threonine protein kinase